ncbi:aminotransferase class I/II-fold pyridoxal phosphate-dependent enzyme [Tardiphaga sp.]|uniref:aminotransferase class I/II-fold pyridoxal phosphate-dependent enzyme n=1 Tax=Tardiphaga sp. TaxID=1926292 RepID=UPI0037D9B852
MEQQFEGAHAPSLNYGTLPGFAELKYERLIGDRIGLSSPYFRAHDGRPGSRTVIDGQEVINFSSYDYLGLNADDRLADVAKAAIDRYGVSATGSRHVAGEREIHRELERNLAAHYASEDCVVLVSGYATNLGVIGQLVGPKDILICDQVIHNSATMGGVLSGAARRSFAHNDLDDLERLLKANRGKFGRALIVVEGLYGMDGDVPDLKRLIELKKRYSAWLMVDEAHALGVIGATGAGSFEHCGVDPRDVDIWMGTLSKTLAGCGGYIATSAELVDYIKSLVSVFVYSVAMPPVIAAAANFALQTMHKEPERVTRLHSRARFFDERARAKRLLTVAREIPTAVSPIIIGDSIPAVALSHALLRRGVNVMPVLYPAVPAKAARLRFFLNATHGEDDIEKALDVTAEELTKMPELLKSLGVPGY